MTTINYGQSPFDREHAKLLLDTKLNPAWIEQRTQGGSKLSYIPGHIAIHLLNKAFDGNWSFEILEHGVIGEPGKKGSFLFVKARLEVPGLGVREQFGNQGFMGNMMDEHIFKGATTDALKKCASMFGVALELYGDAEGLVEGYHNLPDDVANGPQVPQQPVTQMASEMVAKDDLAKPKADAAPAVAEAPKKKASGMGWEKEDVEQLKTYRTELGRLQGMTPEQSEDNSLLDPFLQEFFQSPDATFKLISKENIKDVNHFLRDVIDGIHAQEEGAE